MYTVLDGTRIIAYHEDEDVVLEYIDKIYKYHNILLDVGKKKHSKLLKMFGNDDLYLVRYGTTYIQQGYYEYMSLVSDQNIYDNKFCKEVLLRICSTEKLSEKKLKTLSKAILIVDDILQDCEDYTPTLHELKGFKVDYDPYIYNHDIWEKDIHY